MKKRLFFALLVLILSGLACRFDRVLNPALPTFTPTVDPAEPVIPTATPTPTPIPTPLPGARIETGDDAYFIGDWALAVQEYSTALNTATENSIKSAAMLGLGRTYLQQNQLDAALNTLTNAISSYPDSPGRGEMFFVLGEVYEALGQPQEAINAFQDYLNLRPGLIEAYIYERIGDNYLAMGSYLQEIDAYTNALQAGHGDIYLNVQIGDAYFELSEYATAWSPMMTYLTAPPTITSKPRQSAKWGISSCCRINRRTRFPRIPKWSLTTRWPTTLTSPWWLCWTTMSPSASWTAA